MGYYYRWEDFPEKEVAYLKGSHDASKLLITILSTANIMLSKINAKKGANVPRHYHEAEQFFSCQRDECGLQPGMGSRGFSAKETFGSAPLIVRTVSST